MLTISTFSTEIDSVVKILSEESKTAIDWLHTNDMIANSQKFQTILISKIKNAIPDNQTIIYINDIKTNQRIQ